MKFYFQDRQGKRRKLTKAELRQRLTEEQIKAGIEAKRTDPLEEVAYMTNGGYVVVEIE